MFSALLLIFSATQALTADAPWPCNRQVAIAAFEKKTQTNPWPSLEDNPYKNQTEKSRKEIADYMKDETIVCAIRYLSEKKDKYETRDFSNEAAALNANFIVTHQGRCAGCSNLKDLAVYLKMNLTTAVRACGMRGISPLVRRCLYGLGFTSSCVDIWEANISNTRSNCFWVCIKAWWNKTPFNKPDGSLNDCLQCDEDKSGPVFKYYSGRTRRNSGINSAINRPGSQVYHMNHCYY